MRRCPDAGFPAKNFSVNAQNRPVIVSVLMDGRGVMNAVEIDANIMTSAYGKDNIKAFLKKTFADANNFYYVEIKKSLALADTLGLQLPNTINKTGFYNSIHKSAEISQQFSITEPGKVKEGYELKDFANTKRIGRALFQRFLRTRLHAFHAQDTFRCVFSGARIVCHIDLHGANAGAFSAGNALFLIHADAEQRKIAHGF